MPAVRAYGDEGPGVSSPASRPRACPGYTGRPSPVEDADRKIHCRASPAAGAVTAIDRTSSEERSARLPMERRNPQPVADPIQLPAQTGMARILTPGQSVTECLQAVHSDITAGA